MTVVREGSRGAVLLAACITGACFHVDTAEGPSAVPQPRLVSVRVEYRQPNGCANLVNPCDGPVVFFGSWMRAGGEVLLTVTPGTYTWTGTVTNVPANFPPREQPYFVRVFDPHLIETATGGVAASRLIVGGQTITQFDSPGTTSESGLIYIDDNGQGHSPF